VNHRSQYQPNLEIIKSPNLQILISAFLWSFSAFLILFGSASLPGYDAYYHIQMADLMRTSGEWAIKEFPWTTCSSWSEPFFNKDWLFHIYLVPFALLFGKITGAKIAIIFTAFIIAMAWGVLLKTLKVKQIFFAMLFMIFCVGYIYPGRLILCRAFLLAVFFMPIAINCAIRKKRVLLVLSVYLYTLSYVGACQMIPVIFVFDLFNIKETIKKKKGFNNLMFPWALAGFLAGLMITPYFPINIKAIYIQAITVLKAQWLGVDSGVILPIGTEFQSIPAKHFACYIFLIILYFFSIDNLIRRKHILKLKTEEKAFFLLTTIYLALTLFTQKFIEYLVPCFTVAIFQYWTNHPHPVWERFLPFHKTAFVDLKKLTLIFLLLITGAISITMLRKNFYKKHLIYYDSAEWIKNNVKENTLIFSGDWDDNVILFHHLPNHKVLVVLEPFFMYAKSADKFLIWHKIVQGKVEDVVTVIKSNFTTDTVFVPPDRQRLRHRLLMHKDAKLVYEGKSGESIFIIEKPGDPEK